MVFDKILSTNSIVELHFTETVRKMAFGINCNPPFPAAVLSDAHACGWQYIYAAVQPSPLPQSVLAPMAPCGQPNASIHMPWHTMAHHGRPRHNTAHHGTPHTSHSIIYKCCTTKHTTRPLRGLPMANPPPGLSVCANCAPNVESWAEINGLGCNVALASLSVSRVLSISTTDRILRLPIQPHIRNRGICQKATRAEHTHCHNSQLYAI